MSQKPKKQKSVEETENLKRQLLLIVVSFVLALCSNIVGMVCGKNLSHAQWVPNIILWTCIALGIAMIPLNICLAIYYAKKQNEKPVEYWQQYMLEHRESAKTEAAKMLVPLKKLRYQTYAYQVGIALLAVGIALAAGMLWKQDWNMLYVNISALFFYVAISHIPQFNKKAIFNKGNHYVSQEEYPTLYEIAYEASKAVQCTGEIKISLAPDWNAGIAKIGDTYSIQLGITLMHILSREELFHVLLHEFAHVKEDNEFVEANKEGMYHWWICAYEDKGFFNQLAIYFFCYWDCVYTLQYQLYHMAISVYVENVADRKMALCGNPKIAASALLKMKYYEAFEWEKEYKETESILAPETPKKTFLQEEIQLFYEVMPQRMEAWNQLVHKEIMSRNSTHPILKMRLETLGIDQLQIIETKKDVGYEADRQKALEYAQQKIYEMILQDYEKSREEMYEKPCKTITQWEEEGKPIVAERYRDVVDACCTIGKYTLAEEICDCAIAQLPEVACPHAYYIKGCMMLHRYDTEGISLIYRAIDNNTNYIAEGLDLIGVFSCFTGNQEQLDLYRKKSVELGQKQKDEYDQLSVLKKKDNLVPENLPKELLEQILEHIHSVDAEERTIANIYLVRKVISEDFFTSVFVIRFEKKTSFEKQALIMHKIFQYLDTCSDWQFSLFLYDAVKSVKVDKIPGSCVYSKS